MADSFNMAYWNTSVKKIQPHDKLWLSALNDKLRLSALKGIIVVFCSTNFVCDENNSTLIHQLFYLRIDAFLQISAHSKSDTDEVAL